MKPKPKFKKQFTKAETGYFKSIADGVREIRLKATNKPVEAQTPSSPYIGIDPQAEVINA